VDALYASPLGCAFLLTLEASGVPPAIAARPDVAVEANALAWSDLGPWWPHHPEVVAAALGHGPRLLPSAQAILAQPAAVWWFAPLDRRSQRWVSWPPAHGDAPDPSRLRTPTGALTNWARYAQGRGLPLHLDHDQ